MKPSKLIGQKFGCSTVLKEIGVEIRKDGNQGRKYRIFECKCDCGTIYTVNHRNLVHTRTKFRSCGCMKKEDLTNKKFGDLTVIKFVGKRPIGNYSRVSMIWECVCSCGKISNVVTANLLSGNTQSCGCRKAGKSIYVVDNYHRLTYKKSFRKIRQNAKNKKLEFNITIDYIETLMKLQNNRCFLSNILIHIEDGSASLDRIDSSKGYIEGNVQWVHRTYNRMKNILTQKEFIQLCKLVSNNHPDY